jgi:hypothetical protein
MKKSLGACVTHIAVALYLLAGGILGLMERTLWQKFRLTVGARNATGNEIVDTFSQVFGMGDPTKILIVLFSVFAIAAGVFLLLEIFGIKISAADLIILAFLIVWLAFIVLSDGVYALKGHFTFLPWLRLFASHLVVLGVLISASRKFGGA